MSYWKKRMLDTQEIYSNKKINSINEQLILYYARSAKRVIKSFERTYLKVLSSVNRDEPVTIADLYKLNTYWEMQGQLRDELQKLGEREVRLYTRQFESEYRQVYNALAIKTNDSMFTHIGADKAKNVLHSVWCSDGKHWSDRVWNNIATLQQTLNDELSNCIITGRTTAELETMLMNRFDVSYGRASTLVRTEIAHLETQASIDRFKDSGIRYARVLVEQDDNTCDDCASMEDEIIDLYSSDEVPPFHPNCRCCLIPILDEEEEAE